PEPRVGDHRRRLVRIDVLRVIVIERGDELLIRVGRALEDPGTLPALEVDLIDPGTRRIGAPARTPRPCSTKIDRAMVTSHHDALQPVRQRPDDERRGRSRRIDGGDATATALPASVIRAASGESARR